MSSLWLHGIAFALFFMLVMPAMTDAYGAFRINGSVELLDRNGNEIDDLVGARNIAVAESGGVPYAFISGPYAAVTVADLNSPQNPAHAATLSLEVGLLGVDVGIIGGSLYLFAGSMESGGTISVFDASNPYSVAGPIAGIDSVGHPDIIHFDTINDTPYLFVGSSYYRHGSGDAFAVHVVDVSDPAEPRVVKSVDAAGSLDRYDGLSAIESFQRDSSSYLLLSSSFYGLNTEISVLDVTDLPDVEHVSQFRSQIHPSSSDSSLAYFLGVDRMEPFEIGTGTYVALNGPGFGEGSGGSSFHGDTIVIANVTDPYSPETAYFIESGSEGFANITDPQGMAIYTDNEGRMYLLAAMERGDDTSNRGWLLGMSLTGE